MLICKHVSDNLWDITETECYMKISYGCINCDHTTSFKHCVNVAGIYTLQAKVL